LRISIITVCFNAEKTIENTIKSVLSQDYNNIEYILIDGYSTDRTMRIVSDYYNNINVIISEKDNGIYDAINKGIMLASGEIIGLLHADDEFYDTNIITKVAKVFEDSPKLDSIIGDIVFEDDSNQIIRKYSSKNWSVNLFSWGIMPPHPSFYCKRIVFFKFGFYNTDFKIAADFELLIRFLKIKNISFIYVPLVIVKMKLGGASTRGISSLLTINREIYKACGLNSINTNYFKLYSKYFLKIFEFIHIK